MKLIYVQEVGENSFKDIEELSTETIRKLTKVNCVKCEKPFPKKSEDIHYADCSNKIVWWHRDCLVVSRKKFDN